MKNKCNKFYFTVYWKMINGTMKKWLPFILIIILALALFVIKRCNPAEDTRKKTTDKPKKETARVNRDRGFDRRTAYLEYSKHAKCRMDCRHISQQEVKEIMEKGSINYKKSDLNNARCPRYAIEGETADDQQVRIVFAQCNESTVVVTVIDLETEFTCDCPGDDNKFKNQH
jgi:hypothetical protein